MNIINVNYAWNGSLTYGNKPNTIVLHHAEASTCSVEDIHRWHLANGWCGIGYHYFVRKDGTVWKGRPDNAWGAHCPGYNDHSIGICAEGCYMTEDMPTIQKNAIIELVKSLGIKKVFGHGELYPTSCPGSKYPLSDIKNAITNPSIPWCGYYLYYNPNNYDENVKKVQAKLGCGDDGYFGRLTKQAVINFQRQHGLDIDGVVGIATWTCLFNG